MNFKVGQKVLVKAGLESGKQYWEETNTGRQLYTTCSSEHKELEGFIATIRRVLHGGGFYTLEENPSPHFAKSMLQPIDISPDEAFSMLVKGQISQSDYKELTRNTGSEV